MIIPLFTNQALNVHLFPLNMNIYFLWINPLRTKVYLGPWDVPFQLLINILMAQVKLHYI